jgi:hypothetical protein
VGRDLATRAREAPWLRAGAGRRGRRRALGHGDHARAHARRSLLPARAHARRCEDQVLRDGLPASTLKGPPRFHDHGTRGSRSTEPEHDDFRWSLSSRRHAAAGRRSGFSGVFRSPPSWRRVRRAAGRRRGAWA